MTLSKFIDELGDKAAAELFGVKQRTAASWRRGERLPRQKQAAHIVDKTNGVVGYEDIFRPQVTAA